MLPEPLVLLGRASCQTCPPVTAYPSLDRLVLEECTRRMPLVRNYSPVRTKPRMPQTQPALVIGVSVATLRN